MTARLSATVGSFADSRIREINQLALLSGAVNLGQGFPDFPAPAAVKEAARLAIDQDANQYTVPAGDLALREALAERYRQLHGLDVDPVDEVCVTSGATEAMTAVLLALLDPGDEVIIFEPFYEGYVPQILLAGGVPRPVPLRGSRWAFDPELLERVTSRRTRAVILNNPHNPCGKVFSADELAALAAVCQRYGLVAISDEVYEHIVYDGRRHVPLASVPGMAESTITISSMSKTYSVTGWRLGWAVGPRDLATGFRRVHDFISVCSPSVFQPAGVAALCLPQSYYDSLLDDYVAKRDRMVGILRSAGIEATPPEGAYYVLGDISSLGRDDVDAAKYLMGTAGVAGIPISCFYLDASPKRHLRFAFCKRDETLAAAGDRLRALLVAADGSWSSGTCATAGDRGGPGW